VSLCDRQTTVIESTHRYRTSKTENFTQIFTKFRNISALQGRIPFAIFYDICRLYRCVLAFRDALAVKIWMDFLEGLRSCGFESSFPKIFSAPSGKTLHRTAECFRGARTCSRSCITMPKLVRLGLHPSPWRPKTFSFLNFA